jgi:hypothetical protein
VSVVGPGCSWLSRGGRQHVGQALDPGPEGRLTLLQAVHAPLGVGYRGRGC